MHALNIPDCQTLSLSLTEHAVSKSGPLRAESRHGRRHRWWICLGCGAIVCGWRRGEPVEGGRGEVLTDDGGQEEARSCCPCAGEMRVVFILKADRKTGRRACIYTHDASWIGRDMMAAREAEHSCVLSSRSNSRNLTHKHEASRMQLTRRGMHDCRASCRRFRTGCICCKE